MARLSVEEIRRLGETGHENHEKAIGRLVGALKYSDFRVEAGKALYNWINFDPNLTRQHLQRMETEITKVLRRWRKGDTVRPNGTRHVAATHEALIGTLELVREKMKSFKE